MSTQDENRSKFLLELYNQLWNSINARLSVSWQSIGILVSAFAIMALTEKQIISISYSSSIIVLLVFWYLAHLIDFSYSYNRNQAIISNIEREFLNEGDSTLIHLYFLSHRPNKMVYFLKIQSWLGAGIGLIVLILHFFGSVLPIIKTDKTKLNFEILFPYILLVVFVIILISLWDKRNKEYTEFIKKSPGKVFLPGTSTIDKSQNEN